jgi:ubiquinone/menaquinone biosynthesis C-methylase UbiE
VASSILDARDVPARGDTWKEAMTEQAGTEGLRRLYASRFTAADGPARDAVWRVLCTDFFQRWIDPGSTVLELGAGYCEFINNIQAGEKIAVDLNPEIKRLANSDVRTIITSATDLAEVRTGSVDAVFAANFFEHISKDEILQTLGEAHRVLSADGKLLVLQPNIRLCREAYWMFFDHISPLDERALNEALAMTDFVTEKTIVRFLPYTMKSYLPTSAALVRAYLKFPPLWRLVGKQTFVVASPR